MLPTTPTNLSSSMQLDEEMVSAVKIRRSYVPPASKPIPIGDRTMSHPKERTNGWFERIANNLSKETSTKKEKKEQKNIQYHHQNNRKTAKKVIISDEQFLKLKKCLQKKGVKTLAGVKGELHHSMAVRRQSMDIEEENDQQRKNSTGRAFAA